MGQAIIDLSVEQGVDFLEQYIFANEDASGDWSLQNYVNFTGYGLRMQARYALDPTSTQLFAFTVGAGLSLISLASDGGPPAPSFPNAIQIRFTRTQTLTYPAGTYYYDLLGDIPGPTTTRLMSGLFSVQTTVAR